MAKELQEIQITTKAHKYHKAQNTTNAEEGRHLKVSNPRPHKMKQLAELCLKACKQKHVFPSI